MSSTEEAFGAALRQLLVASHLSGPDDLPGLIQHTGSQIGAQETVIYVIDYDQVVLIPLLTGLKVDRPQIAVDGTLAGRAFAEVTPCETTTPEATIAWMPILDGTERLGVLQLNLSPGQPITDQLRDRCHALASITAELILTRSLYGDSIERA